MSASSFHDGREPIGQTSIWSLLSPSAPTLTMTGRSIPKRDDGAATGARRLTQRPQVQCARVFVAESAISMWDRGIAGSHSLAPVHCDSCAITEHLSSVRSLQLGESRWVERYIMCTWPLLTLHMHARACQSRYPLGRPSALDTPICTPWESHLRSIADKDGK